MTVYVVTMYRYGDHEKHSYVLGAFTTLTLAEKWGRIEEYARGGKYKYEFVVCTIDEIQPDPILEDQC